MSKKLSKSQLFGAQIKIVRMLFKNPFAAQLDLCAPNVKP